MTNEFRTLAQKAAHLMTLPLEDPRVGDMPIAKSRRQAGRAARGHLQPRCILTYDDGSTLTIVKGGIVFAS